MHINVHVLNRSLHVENYTTCKCCIIRVENTCTSTLTYLHLCVLISDGAINRNRVSEISKMKIENAYFLSAIPPKSS